MRPHPKIRKMVKWGGAAVCALFLLVWLSSGCFAILYSPPGGGFISFGAGQVSVCGASDGSWPGLHGRWAARCTFMPLQFNFVFHHYLNYWRLQIPLWALFAVSVLLHIALRWADAITNRRAKLGVCPKCSYSRTGLAPEAVCPECGTPAPDAPAAS